MTHPHDPARPPRVRFAWLTVSDSRREADDRSGETAARLLAAAGHEVAARALEPDEPARVRARVEAWLADDAIDAVVTSGGTGVSARDRTFEALDGLIERRLDGFGELFRMLSWQQVGSRSMLSRAVGGIAAGKPLFLLPGSPQAVELGLSQLVLPEIGHLLAELAKHAPR